MSQDIQEITIKEDDRIIQQSEKLVLQVQAMQIKDDLTCSQAIEFGKSIKEFIEGPGAYHDDEIALANALHKKLTQKRNRIIDGPKMAYKVLKDRIAQFQYEKQRKIEEARRQAEAEARRQEAEKQAKIQAKIDEENRRIAEQKRIEDKKRQEEEKAVQAIKDEEKAQAMREQYESDRNARANQLRADEEKAQIKIETLEEKKDAVYVAPKAIQEVAQPKGVSVQFDYEPVVTDKSQVPDTYKVVDLAMLKKMQKAAKGNMEVPGIRWNKKPIGSIRS